MKPQRDATATPSSRESREQRWFFRARYPRLGGWFLFLLIGIAVAPDARFATVPAVADELTQSAISGRGRRRRPGRFNLRRHARPTQIGKNHQLVRDAFESVVKDVNRFTVRVMNGEQQVAFGTIVTPQGLVLTKASELPANITCRVPGHGEFEAKSLVTNEQLDLAILQLADCKQPLPSIRWNETTDEIDVGSWVAVPSGFGERPLVVGVVSARLRDIQRDSAVLGIMIEDGPNGVMVVRVVPSSGADLAGVTHGDVVTKINGASVRRQRELVREVRKLTPGDQVQLQIQRGEQSLVVAPTLGRDTEVALAASGQLERHELRLSERRSGFPHVIQHDCLLQPRQCGGPLVNLDGQVIGFNVARAGRVATYALAVSHVAETIQGMIAKAK